jgi:hypothetical protein
MYGDMCIVSLDTAVPVDVATSPLATAATAQSAIETVMGWGMTESKEGSAKLQ